MPRTILGRRPQEWRGSEKARGDKGGRWKAAIRRRGYPPASRSFGRKTDAEKWARGIEAKIEAKIEAGKFRDESQARGHTAGDPIDRYIAEIIPGCAEPNPRHAPAPVQVGGRL